MPSSQSVARPARVTWAELAWLLIGIYWIVLGSFVIPARLHEFKLGDTVLFGLVPFVGGAWASAVSAQSRRRGRDATPAWTHTAAVVLLMTWPIAWICLIVLGRSLQ